MKTTKEHFKIFKDECQYWVDKFKLDNWKVYFVHKQRNPKSYATCETKISSNVCTIFFADDWDDLYGSNPPVIENIARVAKHEMLHLLLARVSDYATSRQYTASDCYEAEEELVIKLESIIK